MKLNIFRSLFFMITYVNIIISEFDFPTLSKAPFS